MKSKEEIPEIPVGDFVLSNAEGVQCNDGRWYHYAEVCTLLKAYARQEVESRDARIRELEAGLKAMAEQYEISLRNDMAKIGKNWDSVYPDYLPTLAAAKQLLNPTNDK